MNRPVSSLNELSTLIEDQGITNTSMPRITFSSDFNIGKREIEAIRSIARKLERSDKTEAAFSLLTQLRERHSEHEWLGFHTCRVATLLGLTKEAREIFSKFGQNSTDQRWMLLSCILARQENNVELCFENTQRYVSAIPTIIRSANTEDAPTVCVLKQKPLFISKYSEHVEKYIGGNAISQFLRVNSNTVNARGFLVDVDTTKQALKMIPAPDVVFNNIATGEHFGDPAILQGAETCIAHWGKGCINPPSRVYRTARDKNTSNFAGLPDVIYPKTEFHKIGEGKKPKDLISTIEASNNFPLIVRPPAKQDGEGMMLVRNREELEAAISKWPQGFFTIEYLENTHNDLFRKIRAVFIRGNLHVIRVDHGEDWMLHGHRDQPHRIKFYNDRPELIEREKAICHDPHGELGKQAIRALESIKKVLELDFLGIDFDVSDDGKIVVFEANPAMNILGKIGTEIPHPKETEEAAMADFKKMIFSAMSVQ